MKTQTAPLGAGTRIVVSSPTHPARPAPATLKSRLLPWLALLALAAGTPASSAELLQNNDFSSGLDHWSMPVDLAGKNWNPLQNSEVNLHPPFGFAGYQDDVIYQPLNIPVIGEVTVTAGIRLRQDFSSGGDRTIAVILEYVTLSNQVQRVKAFDVLNEQVTDIPGESSLFQATFDIPAEARKLTKFIIAKQTWGSFFAVGASLTSAQELIPGTVPQITQVSGSGAFGAPLTVNGANFGSNPGMLLLDGSPALLTVQDWTATTIQALVQEPAKSADVRLIQDYTESWGGANYYITSPTLELTIHQPRLDVIRGSIAKFVVQADFFNGYTSADGVGFVVPQAPPGLATFSPLPLRNSGGVLLSIPTTSLAAGTYQWTVQSVEAGTVPRSFPITLVVHQVASATFIQGGAPVTSLNVSQQGEIHVGFELRNSAGDLLPTMDCEYSSSNSDVLLTVTRAANGGFRVFAQAEGSANLILSAPDGFTATLPVTIANLSSQRMTSVGFTNPFPNNSGASTTRFSASALAGINGWGQEGMLETEPSLYEAFANFSFHSTFAQSDSFAIAEGQKPDTFLFYASTPGGAMYTTLTVVNAPNLAGISGEVNSLGEFGFPGAEGRLEFFSPEDDSDPLFEREIFNYHSAAYIAGAIPPGSYKVRLASSFADTVQWFPNTEDFDQAQVLSFTVGATRQNIHFFPPPTELRFTSQPRDQIVAEGASATFAAAVSGGFDDPTFQWQENGVNISDGPDFSGANTPILTIENCQTGDSGKLYTLLVNDSMGGIVSRTALLTVGQFDPPDVTTLASNHPQAQIRALRAVVAGEVNPNGAPANVTVKWGLSAAPLNQSTAAVPAVVTGSAPVSVTANLTGLSPNTTYFYRFEASNSAGNGAGAVLSFTTPAAVPPLVQTLPADTITHDAALLHGTVNPRGDDTMVAFEFGTSNALGQTVLATPNEVSSDSVQAVSATIALLLPHTTYHYRVRAASDSGAANGAIRTFTTANRDVVAKDDDRALLPSSPAFLDVLANDSDPDGDDLRVHSFTQTPASVGRVARAGNDLMFTPSAAFNGGTFTYTVTDGFGSFATATVTLTRAPCQIDPAAWTLPAGGGSHNVAVTTTAPWRVLAAPAWISSMSEGVGNGIAVIQVAPNASLAPRTGFITIGGESHTITQEGVQAPDISVPDIIPLGIVSGDYELVIPTTNPPATYTARNLPPGLRIDQANGVIFGKPRRHGDFDVEIQARNRADRTAKIEFRISVDELPDHATGTFGAVIAREFTVNESLGGMVNFTVAGTGSYSGMLRMGGATGRFSGWLDASVGGPIQLNATVRRRNAPAVMLNLELQDSPDGPVTEGKATLDIPFSPEAAVEGAVQPWSARNRATDYAANFNFALSPEDADNENAPRGHGFLVLRALANGRTTWSGSLADGARVTGSSALWINGGFPVYVPLYRGLGSLHGTAQVGATPDPDDLRAIRDGGGDLTVLKKPDNSRAYAAGYGPVNLQTAASQYIRPLRGEIVLDYMDVERGETNASIDFERGGIENTDFGGALGQDFRVLRSHGTIFSNDRDENPGRVRITRLNPANGTFAGSVILVDENPDRDFQPETRRVNFQGVILLNLGEGLGYFLLVDLSSPPVPQGRMPLRSGAVRLN
jgi:hypothetical protein